MESEKRELLPMKIIWKNGAKATFQDNYPYKWRIGVKLIIPSMGLSLEQGHGIVHVLWHQPPYCGLHLKSKTKAGSFILEGCLLTDEVNLSGDRYDMAIAYALNLVDIFYVSAQQALQLKMEEEGGSK
jgi:hypothetical protein